MQPFQLNHNVEKLWDYYDPLSANSFRFKKKWALNMTEILKGKEKRKISGQKFHYLLVK